MKIFRHLFLFVFLAAFQQIQAVTVTTTAGNLEQVLENNLSQLNNLTVNGTMDARDFKFIADELPALQTLNLANATIVEYSANKAVFANYILYEKNVLPQLSLMGTNLRNIVLPNSITTIGEGAFAGCTKLETIEIPANVTTVGNYAFSGCSALTDITGGNNVTSIGDYAFSQCAALQNVSGNAAKAIGAYAFLNCSQLSDFDFNSSLSVLEEGAFQGTALHSANLSNCGQLTAVGAWAFADTPNLTDVQLPSSVEAIGDGAFFYSTSLHQVNLPSKLTRINDFTFMGGQITDPQLLPESLKEIGNFALAAFADKLEKAPQADLDALTKFMKEIVGDEVKEVRTTERLTKSPVALSTGDGEASIHLERLMRQHNQPSLYVSNRYFDINPRHPLIKKLAAKVAAGDTSDTNKALVQVLFDQAKIIEGEPIKDPAAFSQRVTDFMMSAVE